MNAQNSPAVILHFYPSDSVRNRKSNSDKQKAPVSHRDESPLSWYHPTSAAGAALCCASAPCRTAAMRSPVTGSLRSRPTRPGTAGLSAVCSGVIAARAFRRLAPPGGSLEKRPRWTSPSAHLIGMDNLYSKHTPFCRRLSRAPEGKYLPFKIRAA